MRGTAAVFVVALLVGACASSAPPTEGYARDRITREDIASTLALDAYDAIRLLRPRWLSGPFTVYQNGVLVSENATAHLRALRTESVVEIAYVEHEVARTIYGYSIRGGVIEVDTDRR